MKQVKCQLKSLYQQRLAKVFRVGESTGVALAELEMDFEEWMRFGKLKRKE